MKSKKTKKTKASLPQTFAENRNWCTVDADNGLLSYICYIVIYKGKRPLDLQHFSFWQAKRLSKGTENKVS